MWLTWSPTVCQPGIGCRAIQPRRDATSTASARGKRLTRRSRLVCIAGGCVTGGGFLAAEFFTGVWMPQLADDGVHNTRPLADGQRVGCSLRSPDSVRVGTVLQQAAAGRCTDDCCSANGHSLCAFLQGVFGTTALTGGQMLIVLGLSSIVFIAVELSKLIRRRS